LTVTVKVTQDITSDIGFSIQLNADSPAGAEPDAWQQYGFTIIGNSIQGFINNWQNGNTAINCDQRNVGSTPLNNGIPAGYTLVLQLQYDGSQNVIGAVYQVFDQNSNSSGPVTFLVQNAACNCAFPSGFTCTGYQGVTDLSPITAFELNIVGPGGGQNANFSSGAGSITYSVGAPNQISAQIAQPACTEVTLITAETGNSSYGTLSACPAQSLTQQFST
jgi:hypothetical protein